METYRFTANLSWKIMTKQPPEMIARWAVPQVQQLGPVYIKFAQFLSVRRDIFQDGVIQELSKVQKECDAMQISKLDVVKILMEESGDMVYDLKIDDAPIGIASLGQVHKAKHKDGRVMAVKVLRKIPDNDLKRSFMQMSFLGWILDLANPSMSSHTLDIVKEYQEMLYEEMNYQQEAMNATMMREHFRDVPWVKIPEVYFSTKRCIWYEYVKGVPIDDIEELSKVFDTRVLANRVYKMYLKQLFETGFFHADLHPGNIVIEADTGNVVMYDYGMTGEITPFMRESFTRLITAIYTKDDSMMLYALQDLHIISGDAKLRNVRSSLDFILGLALKSSSLSPEILQKKISKIPKDNFNIPSELIFWFRSIAFVQSAVVNLDPSYDFEAPLKKYISNATTIESFAKGFLQAGNTSYKIEQGVESMKHSLQSLENLQTDVLILKTVTQGIFAMFLLQALAGENVMSLISMYL